MDDTTRQVREALKYAELVWSRYHDHGDPKDLKAVTGTFRRILANADVVATLPREAEAARANLALALIEAFDYDNEIRHLDESIDLSNKVLRYEPDGAGRLATLNVRYVARLKRFAVLREPADLDDAAAAVEDMARFAPDAVPTLMNRAQLLMRRFDANGSLDALDEAIVTFERCADVATEQHAVPLGALAQALVERHRLRRRVGDIDRAFHVQQRALDLLPADAPARRDHLLTLGIIALEQAIGHGDDVRLTPGLMLNLGLGIRERWRLRRVPADLELARAYFRVAMTDPTKPIVYLAAADEGGVALSVTPAEAAPTINTCWLPDLTDRALRERLRGPDGADSLGGYLGAYSAWQTTASDEAANEWAAVLDDLLRWCWTVAIGPVLDVLPPTTDRVVVIAAGPLGVIPCTPHGSKTLANRRGGATRWIASRSRMPRTRQRSRRPGWRRAPKPSTTSSPSRIR